MGSDNKRVKLEDLAKYSGVSVASVSRVINKKPVSADIVAKVGEAVAALKYEKTATLVKKKEEGNKIIALFVLDILNPFYPVLIRGIEDVVSLQGYNILLCDTRNDDPSQYERMEALIDNGTVEGVIYVPLAVDNPFRDKLIEDRFPIVFVDNIVKKEDTFTVSTDNVTGAYQAVKYLLTLGHKKIVYLAGDRKFNTEQERFGGYIKALEEANIDIDPDLIIHGEYDQQKAYEGLRNLLDNKKSFSAIFSANDIMVFGVKEALNEHGLTIPGDISVIGFDDIAISSSIGLTTFSQPAYEMGRNAAIMLIDLIHKRLRESRHVILQPTIVIRDSCKHV